MNDTDSVLVAGMSVALASPAFWLPSRIGTSTRSPGCALVINLKAAKALGLEVPSALLARADEVIE